MSRFLEAYETYVSRSTDAPLEFGHAAGLSCLSTIALENRWINRGTGIRPNVYVLLVADSSRDRKSTSVTLATDLLREVVPKCVGPEDFTAEGLVSYLRLRRGRPSRSRILLPMSEFGQNLAAAGSYGATIAGTLCKLYDGEDFERVRSGKKPVRIVKPRVSILAAVAYGMLEKYADPLDWVTGLFARFLFVTPLTRRGRFSAPPEKAVTDRDLARVCLADLHKQLKGSAGPMKVSAEADEVYRDWADGFAAEIPDPAMQAQRERLLNSVWKLAMLYQIDVDPMAPIAVDPMRRAMGFAALAWEGVSRVYSVTAGDSQAKVLKRIWRSAEEAGEEGIPRSTLLRNFSLNAGQFQSALDLLCRNGAVSCVKKTKTLNGRTYSTEFVVIKAPYENTENAWSSIFSLKRG